MSNCICDITVPEAKTMLMRLIGFDFLHSQVGPENAIFTLRAKGIDSLEGPLIEWIVKGNSGLLIISEPITLLDFWKLPDDIYIDRDREDAERQIMDDYLCFLEHLEQEAYISSSRCSLDIKVDRSNSPRIYTFLGNNRTDDDFVTAILAMDELLPRIMVTA